MSEKRRAVFLVDGEHHPDTVRGAVRALAERENLEPLALYFLGGAEKLGDASELSVEGCALVVPEDPLGDFVKTLERFSPHVVLDLSDLPVLGPAMRMRMAATALARGVAYLGADFEFRPPRRERVLTKPSCAVIGTGKRCGKTAVSAEMARYLARTGREPLVVAMGRGGPPRPYVVEERVVDEEYLQGELGKGLHAASDHYEDAMVSGVVTVGSRRCGGGMAGEPFVTNCAEAAAVAESLPGRVVIVEGSGSSVPPVLTDTSVLVVSAAQDLEEALGYLGAYRLLISDGVIITMAEEPFASSRRIQELRERMEWISGDVVVLNTIFRPHPLKPIRGRKVFLVATAPPEARELLEKHLREKEGCEVLGSSFNLSRRDRLVSDLGGADEAEVVLTELKAAAVDVVARYARRRGKELVFFHNVPVPTGGDMDLERFFETMWAKATERSCPQKKTKKGKTG